MYYEDLFLDLRCHGIFDFTNLDIFIDGWELKNAIVDTLWGGILYALVTLAAVM